MSKEVFKDETLAEKFIKKGFWLYFFSFLLAPSGYIIKLLISNNLSVKDVGLIYAIIGLVGILSNYNDLGFTESLKYFLPKFWIKKKFDNFKTSIFLALGIQTFTAILIALGLGFGANFLASNYFHSPSASTVLKIFSLFFIVFNIFRTLQTIFEAFQETFVSRFVEFVRMYSIVLIVTILFFSHKGNALTYSLAWFWGVIVGLIISMFFLIKKYKFVFERGKINLESSLVKKIFNYSIWAVIAAQAGIILSSVDLQMIVYFLGPQQAGYYTNYLSMFGIYSIILGPIFGFLFPITTELITKKQHWKLSLMLSIFYKYFLVFGWIFSLFFIFFGPVIAFILFGDKFIFSGELLRYGVGMVFLSILVSINFNILAGLGKIKERVKIIWIATLINVILNFILIVKIGVVGAIISTWISTFIMMIFSYKEILRSNIKINFDWRFYLKNILALFVVTFVLFFALENFSFESRLFDLRKLFFIWIFYMVYFLLVNYREVLILKKQAKEVFKKK